MTSHHHKRSLSEEVRRMRESEGRRERERSVTALRREARRDQAKKMQRAETARGETHRRSCTRRLGTRGSTRRTSRPCRTARRRQACRRSRCQRSDTATCSTASCEGRTRRPGRSGTRRCSTCRPCRCRGHTLHLPRRCRCRSCEACVEEQTEAAISVGQERAKWGRDTGRDARDDGRVAVRAWRCKARRVERIGQCRAHVACEM